MYSQNCGNSVKHCELHIAQNKRVTLKSVVEGLNKLNKRIKQYICFCLLYFFIGK